MNNPRTDAPRSSLAVSHHDHAAQGMAAGGTWAPSLLVYLLGALCGGMPTGPMAEPVAGPVAGPVAEPVAEPVDHLAGPSPAVPLPSSPQDRAELVLAVALWWLSQYGAVDLELVVKKRAGVLRSRYVVATPRPRSAPAPGPGVEADLWRYLGASRPQRVEQLVAGWLGGDQGRRAEGLLTRLEKDAIAGGLLEVDAVVGGLLERDVAVALANAGPAPDAPRWRLSQLAVTQAIPLAQELLGQWGAFRTGQEDLSYYLCRRCGEGL